MGKVIIHTHAFTKDDRSEVQRLMAKIKEQERIFNSFAAVGGPPRSHPVHAALRELRVQLIKARNARDAMKTNYYVAEGLKLIAGPYGTEAEANAQRAKMKKSNPSKELSIRTKTDHGQEPRSTDPRVTHKGNPVFLDAAPCGCKNKAQDASFNAQAEYRSIVSKASEMVRACKNVYLLAQQAGDQAAASEARKVWDAAEKMHSLIHQNA